MWVPSIYCAVVNEDVFSRKAWDMRQHFDLQYLFLLGWVQTGLECRVMKNSTIHAADY